MYQLKKIQMSKARKLQENKRKNFVIIPFDTNLESWLHEHDNTERTYLYLYTLATNWIQNVLNSNTLKTW